MPRVCYITQGRERRVDVSYFEVYHIGVGFVVARSNVLGNAKASGRGTSNKYESCAFLYIYEWYHRGFLGRKRKNNRMPLALKRRTQHRNPIEYYNLKQ
jgi:hypothetical protein